MACLLLFILWVLVVLISYYLLITLLGSGIILFLIVEALKSVRASKRLKSFEELVNSLEALLH